MKYSAEVYAQTLLKSVRHPAGSHSSRLLVFLPLMIGYPYGDKIYLFSRLGMCVCMCMCIIIIITFDGARHCMHEIVHEATKGANAIINIRTHTHANAHTYANTRIHTRMYVCMYVCACMYVCMHACMYVCMYVYAYMYVWSTLRANNILLYILHSTCAFNICPVLYMSKLSSIRRGSLSSSPPECRTCMYECLHMYTHVVSNACTHVPGMWNVCRHACILKTMCSCI